MQEARAAGAINEAARLSQQMPRLQAAAEALVVPNAFGALLQREGALNLNATTSHVRIFRHGFCHITVVAEPQRLSVVSRIMRTLDSRHRCFRLLSSVLAKAL